MCVEESLIRGSCGGLTDKGTMCVGGVTDKGILCWGSLIRGSHVGRSLLRGWCQGAQVGRDGSFSPFLVTETTGEGAESSCTPGKSQMQAPAAPGLGLLLPPLLARGCVRGDGWWREGLDPSESQAVPRLCLTPGQLLHAELEGRRSPR